MSQNSNRPKLRLAIYVILLLSLLSHSACAQRFQELNSLLPNVSQSGRDLMSGYVYSLDFANCLLHPEKALRKRQAWNREGWRYTTELVRELDARNTKEQTQIILLLAGTHDDRAAVAILERLKETTPERVRWASYAALAELGYYTEYHSGLLLSEVIKGSKETTRRGVESCALLLANIIHPEAVWAQDQLHAQRLVDGGLSAQTGPLLAFRDWVLGSK